MRSCFTSTGKRKIYEKIPVHEQAEVVSLIGEIADDPMGKLALHIHIVLDTRDGSAKPGTSAKVILQCSTSRRTTIPRSLSR
jgi:predicted DNA-binding protein with PD1-like motif